MRTRCHKRSGRVADVRAFPYVPFMDAKYITLGVVLGVVIGAAIDNIAMGIGVGVAIGIAAGLAAKSLGRKR